VIARFDMTIFSTVRPLLFRFDPERAHRMTIHGLSLLPERAAPRFDPILRSTVAGLEFASPVGLAAGFDKDAEVPDAMIGLGFGFVEIGTVTPRAQAGNPKPRLFRLVEDEAVINRMGFNNGGLARAHDRLAARHRAGIVGANVGANKDAVDRVADYVAGMTQMAGVADYITINISSPNTPGLRGLQDAGELTALLTALASARAPDGPPLFLKLAPDLDTAAIDAIVKVAAEKVDALIIANTTISRPALLSRYAHETGGLSGAPLADLARRQLRVFRSACGGTLPLIAVGGISDADDAYARIRDGASLIQIYSALVYHGPGLARTIADGIAARLKRDGFASLSEAIGVDAQ
jgi:dihydroorotate dehydrogenase